jgi:hypothetical protein
LSLVPNVAMHAPTYWFRSPDRQCTMQTKNGAEKVLQCRNVGGLWLILVAREMVAGLACSGGHVRFDQLRTWAEL